MCVCFEQIDDKPRFGQNPSLTGLLASVSCFCQPLAAMELSPAFVAPVLARSPALPTGAQRAKLGVNYQTRAAFFGTDLRGRRYI